MKKLTIGFFTDSFYPMIDGVVLVVDNYARRLSKIANVIVFAPSINNIDSKGFNDEDLPYKVVRCKSVHLKITGDYSLPTPDIDSNFKKILNNIKLDIVHIHSPFTLGKIGIKYAKKNNIPIVATLHSLYKQDFQKALKNNFLSSIATKIIINVFNKCDKFLTVNKEVARIYNEEYKLKGTPSIINNATELVDEVSSLDIKALDKEYGLNGSDKVFLFVGRINKLKNIFFIVDSIKLLKEKSNMKFKMLFVGTGMDENSLKDYIKKSNLEKDIIMCGKITDRHKLSSLYKRADLFLFPSFYDTNSLVQIEAACFGTPTLFLKGSATSSTVTDNVNGFITENTTEAYASKIIEVMNEKDLYNKVSNNAKKDIYKTWDDVTKELYKIYLEMIKDKN